MARTSQGEIGYSLPGAVPNPPAKDVETLTRFAGVFDLAYRRFEDLKQAEQRNRQTQIELALERTRTQSMLMQHSNELLDISKVFHEQLLFLHIDAEFSFVWLPNEGKGDHLFWATWMEEQEGEKQFLTKAITYPLDMTEPYTAGCFRDWRSGLAVHEHFIEPAEVENFFISWQDLLEGAKQLKPSYFPEGIYYTEAYMRYGCFGIDIRRPLSQQEKDILLRFAIEFERAYTRFLDLQKAEAQAREAQIEAALERVRSRSMGMQKSEELKEVIQIVYEQLVHLKMPVEHTGFILDYKNRNDYNSWIADHLGSPSYITIPYFKATYYDQFNEAKRQGQNFFAVNLNLKEKNKFYRDLFKHLPGFPEASKEFILKQPALTISTVLLDDVALYIENFSGTPYSNEENDVLMRFGKVFQQTYTRFLDLKKAEAQARENQIQLALERVRARTMAMQRSEELKETSLVLYEQLKILGEPAEQCTIGIIKESEGVVEISATLQGNKMHQTFRHNIDEPIVMSKVVRGWKDQHKSLVLEFKERELQLYNQFRNELVGKEIFPVKLLPGDRWIVHLAYFSMGMLALSTNKPRPKESLQLLERFAIVFEQTYTRFLDLQKAEAQAREAQVEAALERVRSRSLAMHKSEELSDLSLELVKQVQTLGVKTWFCAFNIYDDDPQGSLEWGSNGEGTFPIYRTPREGVFLRYYEAGQRGETLLINPIGKDECPAHYEYLCSLPGVGDQLLKMKAAGIPFPAAQIDHVAYFKYGYLLFISYEPVPESHDIFKRFAKVFEQTYTRFLDLQRAEAQAREAQIEASLERVRSKTMAMHNSREVGETVVTLFDELVKLGLDELDRCGIGIQHQDYVMEAWTASKVNDAKAELVIGHINMKQHPLLQGTYEAWRDKKKTFQYILEGEDKINYFTIINNQPDYKARRDIARLPARVVLTAFYFREGCLYAFSSKVPSDETARIFTRFARVFGQTYRRYLDLQKAEAQAQEAIRRASIERVRGDIASMRTTEDLQRITPLMWNELTALGVPFFRCGVFIIHEQQAAVHVYLSTPEGKSIASLQLAFGSSQLTYEAVANWRKQQVYQAHWEREDFKAWVQTLMQQGHLQQENQYTAGAEVPESLWLHFIPFAQGMLYVGSKEALHQDQLALAQSLADAFATAYARYEDFVRLEAANRQIENTLEDLKATQRQLIQSEKMASLGELTAGIAHEIQNPLNFVNNFSEVSSELLDEMTEELNLGNTVYAKEIAGDIKQNLEKINHHGKRADAIVKGMLQHSQKSTGQKEPTDINALCDEYLRLVFHGLRAKDNSFNAAFSTNLDSSIGLINVIPQEIGRVLLNLFNNAFYALAEKTKTAGPAYSPQVTVSTKRVDNNVEISVADNGNGIPDYIRDKIFQPFFTTKPTGQGTGLGLSLSYDIVKSHGGEIKVEAQTAQRQPGDETEGTKLVISLPA
jgi:signal transduction histidine kinase